MSRQPITIPRARPGPGLDYESLREAALGLVQDFSGLVWTDFNESDPGVTILEQLCYALTELTYRAEFRVEDLLAWPSDGMFQAERQGLYLPQHALPTLPVTAADLARLMLDRVDGLANAWFVPRPPAEPTAAPGGLYDVVLLLPEPAANEDRAIEAARARVLDVYAAHRALCEDVESVNVLIPVRLTVDAEIELDDLADPDSVLARLLFNIERLLAPEPRRQSLAKRMAGEARPADIFHGPAMGRGYIPDDQLFPVPDWRPVDDLLRVMAETDGVLEVRDLAARIDGDDHSYGPGETLPLPQGGVFRLVTHPRGGRHTLKLRRGRRPAGANSQRVQRLLRGLWADQRRTYDTAAECAAVFAPPTGQSRDLGAYVSVQTQFPAAYGIGEYGLAHDASPARRGQARQMKGYLMAFDQAMANYFSQLAFLRQLYSLQAGGETTYAFQSLGHCVPGAAALLDPDYEAGLAALIAEHDPVMARQAAVLDLLLSLYGLALAPPPGPWDDGAGGEHLAATLLRAKRTLLTRLVEATAGRGRGFDHRRPGHGGEAFGETGLEIVARLELEILRAAHAHHGPRRARHPSEITFGRLADRLAWDVIEAARTLEAELALDDELEDEARISPLAGHAVAAALLPALAEAAHYRLHVAIEIKMVELVVRDADGAWWVVGEYEQETVAITAARGFARAARRHRHHHDHALYVVEGTLLRFADDPEGEDDPHEPFKISAILPQEPHGVSHDAWRADTGAILRRNTPAHVALECVYLDEDSMEDFVTLRRAWIGALRPGEPIERAEACLRLKRFLRRHAPRGPRAAG
jgi:hypothetical protein